MEREESNLSHPEREVDDSISDVSRDDEDYLKQIKKKESAEHSELIFSNKPSRNSNLLIDQEILIDDTPNEGEIDSERSGELLNASDDFYQPDSKDEHRRASTQSVSERSVSLTSSLSDHHTIQITNNASRSHDSIEAQASVGLKPRDTDQTIDTRRSLEKYLVGPHPILDYENIISTLQPVDSKVTASFERADNITQVLVLGSTGHIGRWIVKYLAALPRSRLIIHCIIRSNKLQVAKLRLRDALLPICSDPIGLDQIMARVRLWCGDVCKKEFGMSKVEYQKLCRRVEGIYSAIGPDMTTVLKRASGQSAEDFSFYGLMAESSVRYWEHVLEFAVTTRCKHIWAVSNILTTPKLWESHMNGQGHVSLIESSVDSIDVLEKARLSVHTNIFDCIGSCQVVAESILKYVKQKLGYNVTIFRLPPTSFQRSVSSAAERSDHSTQPLSWALLQSIVCTGIMPDVPDSVLDLFGHSIDACVHQMVTLSVSHRRVHWIYNVLDPMNPDGLTKSSLLNMMKSMGIYVNIRPVGEFIGACSKLVVKKASRDLIMQDICDLCQLSPISELQVSTAHLQQDSYSYQDSSKSPTSSVGGDNNNINNDYIKDGLRSLLQSHYFPADSMGTLRTVNECMDAAIKIGRGLNDFGEYLDLVREGWSKLLGEIHSTKGGGIGSTFWAKCLCTRKCVIYLTTLLYMTEREKNNPVIQNEQIRSPVIIVGLNRAGSTLLHSMLGCDHQKFRCPVFLEMLFPYGEKGDFCPEGLEHNNPDAWHRDPRQGATADFMKLEVGLDEMRSIGSSQFMSGAESEEDVVPFEICGRSYALASMLGATEHANWLMANDAAEMKRAYDLHKILFKHLQHQRPGKRFVFRMQWHMIMLDQLLTTYPDADIVFMHRRPISAVQAYCNYEYDSQKCFVYHRDQMLIGKRVAEHMSRAIEVFMNSQETMAVRFVEEHPNLQPPQSFIANIYFEDFTVNPIGHIMNLYDIMELPPLAPVAEKAMWDFLQDNVRHRDLILKSERKDLIFFGLTRESVRGRFRPYMQCYFDENQKLKRKQEYKIARAIRGNSLDVKRMYDSHGTIVMEGKSWLETTGLTSPLVNIEVLMSYARSRFVSSDQY